MYTKAAALRGREVGLKGTIFDIQHFSVHDGPGIRTTVFLKGCQIRCLWCHNPEGLSLRAHELSYVPGKCIGCALCVAACPVHAHAIEDGVHSIDWARCVRCGRCAEACPTRALTLCGREVEAEEVIREVEKDRAYYRENGGMTISGGEPMMQQAFVLRLAELAKQAGLHVAIETNLCYNASWLDDVKAHVDLFLVDWKESDPEKHRAYTGVSNDQVLANIEKLHGEGRSVLLRCPIIPGFNDREDHFRRIAELTLRFPGLIGAEILPYHNLGVSKTVRFGLKGEFEAISLEAPRSETVQAWIQYIRDCGGRLINED